MVWTSVWIFDLYHNGITLLDLIREQFLRELLGQDDLRLTDDQEYAMKQFLEFLDADAERSAYLLTGSAGTGKTFLINLFTRILKRHGYKVILLAPTGRAAKVITRRTKRHAYTIHHHIYSPLENAFGQLAFSLKNNKEESKTVYIIDEASMIGNKPDGGSHRGLLSDLFEYVYRQDPSRKLILVGDPVQLPPVGYADSPALDPNILRSVGIFELFSAHLSEVKRQLVDSGILENAVLIRDAYLQESPGELELDVGRDVQPLENGYEGLEIYMGYHEEGNPDRGARAGPATSLPSSPRIRYGPTVSRDVPASGSGSAPTSVSRRIASSSRGRVMSRSRTSK